MTKRRGWSIKGHSDILRLFFCKGFHEHGSKAKRGIHRLTRTRRELLRYCMEGTMDQRMSIDQYKFFSVHRFSTFSTTSTRGATTMYLSIPTLRPKRGNSHVDHPPSYRAEHLQVHHQWRSPVQMSA